MVNESAASHVGRTALESGLESIPPVNDIREETAIVEDDNRPAGSGKVRLGSR